jgi:hypothetical protein
MCASLVRRTTHDPFLLTHVRKSLKRPGASCQLDRYRLLEQHCHDLQVCCTIATPPLGLLLTNVVLCFRFGDTRVPAVYVSPTLVQCLHPHDSAALPGNVSVAFSQNFISFVFAAGSYEFTGNHHSVPTININNPNNTSRMTTP